MPVSILFENLEAGTTVDEIMEWFHVTREQIVAVLEIRRTQPGSIACAFAAVTGVSVSRPGI